jgi:Caspase domain
VEAPRRALIVAADDYHDTKLARLRAPSIDAHDLAQVLSDRDIGAFEVTTLMNEPEYIVRRKVASFLAEGKREGLLLLHFSCHGVKDEDGHLYYATADTEMTNLDATAVSSEWLNRQMEKSRSRRIVLILDCCHSGAFSRGSRARAGEGVDLKEQFEGRGRVVLTASNSLEYAFEGEALTGEGNPSVFTSALVEGLATGAADRDADSWVSIDELYDYVYDRVCEITPHQTPSKWTFGVEGDLYIARNPHPPEIAPAELPAEIGEALESHITFVREGAVRELGRLLESDDVALAKAARLTLERLTEDDSRRISEAAAACLTAFEPPVSEDQGEPLSAPVQADASPSAQREPAPVPAAAVEEPLEIFVAEKPTVIAVCDATVWVVREGGFIVKIDGDIGEVVGEFRTESCSPMDIAVADDRVWLLCDRWGQAWVDEISTSGEIAHTFSVGRMAWFSSHRAVAADKGAVWIALSHTGTIYRVDTQTLDVTELNVGGKPSSIAVGPDAVWFGDLESKTIRRAGKTTDMRLGPRAPVERVPKGRSALTVAKHEIVALTEDGLIALNAANSRPTWQIELETKPLWLARTGEGFAVYCNDRTLAWVTRESGGIVVDDRPARLSDIAAGPSSIVDLDASADAVWLADLDRGLVMRVSAPR